MQAQPTPAWSVVLVTAAAVLAGCTGPGERLEPSAVQGGQGQGGGSVGNTAPTWTSFTGSLEGADNSGGAVETFTGVVRDANSEHDLASVRVTVSGVLAGNFTHTFTNDEQRAEEEPAGFGADHFKAWTGTRNDGVMNLQFRFTVPLGTPAGVATFTPNVKDRLAANTDAAGVDGPLDATTITVFSEITASGAPVASGGGVSASNWGGWSADPSASDVAATNYIRFTNTGQRPTAEVVLDFTDGAFVGTSDADFSIPIADNVEFAWWEDTTPSASAPSEGTFTFLPANADGSVTVRFTELGNILYITYRIKALPAVLPEQSYVASYTATEL